MQELLEVNNLRAGYSGSSVVNNVTLNCRKGEIVTLTGRNGMGKSTLMKAIMGILPAVEGKIIFSGKVINEFPPHKRYKEGLVYVSQTGGLFTGLTVLENLTIGIEKDEAVENRLNHIFDIFPRLKNRVSARAGVLSGGETKMLKIARGIMSDSKLILLDEPTEGVQPSLVNKLTQILMDLKKDGKGIILSEQRIAFVKEVSDKILPMVNGKIVDEIMKNDKKMQKIEKYVVL